MDEYRFTADTDISIAEDPIQEVHLEDLSFILDFEAEDGEITSCTIDLRNLIQAMTVFSSMERFEYDWRTFGDLEGKPIDKIQDSIQ